MLRTTLLRFGASGIKTPFPSTTHKPQPYTGPAYDQIVKDRKKWMPNFYFHYYKEPLLIVEGSMQYLYDHTGKRYIDCVSGISTISCGHSHPTITKVLQEQSSKLAHTSPIYASEWQGEYSKRICQELGDGFDSVFLCNSGSEANDFAVYLSRLYTHEYKFYSLKNAYHGLVGAAGNITSVGTWNSPMRGGFEFEKLAWPSTYRGASQTLEEYIKDAEETINATAGGGKIAGMIAEPIQGVGGINPLPAGYMAKMAELVRKYNGLVIADEVQTGFGRVGTKYWGHRWQGVKPDIVTMAKGIGNGFPMAAVATRKEITDKITQVFFNTFGGGHLQCRVGIEVLDTIRREKLPENAEKVGGYLIAELTKLK
jgi:alanine-glyoxylate transaminase / (R)-3-amino-2-methylpropionate-pyruvate transaminase